jgi:carbonic anhydrase/acetyltransferase-like protein (isoleucine patch superfamily)
MPIRSYEDKHPTIGDETFVAETAMVIGDVEIGQRSSLWYGVVVRGDVYHIRIGDETSIQDNTVIHVTSGRHATIVGSRVTVGHGAILHGCTIDDECIIGMGAIIMDRARIGKHCVVGAGALVTPGTEIPDGRLVIGSPAKPKRELSSDELDWIRSSAHHYVALAKRYLAGA